MRTDRGEADFGERQHDASLPTIEGISAGAVAAFCDAIEFGVHEQQPTEAEVVQLRAALHRIVIEAQAAKMTPERLLIGLKNLWIKVCHRHPAPDMHDPTWHIVTRESLDAWHSE